MIVGDPVERARALILFADGLEVGGLDAYARRARDVAHDTIELAEQLAAMRDSLTAVTADRDRWRENRWQEAHGEPWPT